MTSPRGPSRKRISHPVAAVRAAVVRRPRNTPSALAKNSDAVSSGSGKNVSNDGEAKTARHSASPAVSKAGSMESNKSKNSGSAQGKRKGDEEHADEKRTKDAGQKKVTAEKSTGPISTGGATASTSRSRGKGDKKTVAAEDIKKYDHEEAPVTKPTAKTRRQRQLLQQLQQQQEDNYSEGTVAAIAVATAADSSSSSDIMHPRRKGGGTKLVDDDEDFDEAPPSKKRRVGPSATGAAFNTRKTAAATPLTSFAPPLKRSSRLKKAADDRADSAALAAAAAAAEDDAVTATAGTGPAPLQSQEQQSSEVVVSDPAALPAIDISSLVKPELPSVSPGDTDEALDQPVATAEVAQSTEEQSEPAPGSAVIPAEIKTSLSPTSLPAEAEDATATSLPLLHRDISHTASLFRRMPESIRRGPPVIVLDNWSHGQLVWWNRFLANRKKSQGTSIGNFVGRVVDLESEWFPTTELGSMKSRLRSLAAAMGRRSLFVQSLDEMRYLTLPPRAVTPFPDPDPTLHNDLLTGLYRGGPLSARKGLQLALMLTELRTTIGDVNSLLEIEFLDLCMTAGDHCNTEDDLKQLESLSAFDVLKHRKFRAIPGSRAKSYATGLYPLPTLNVASTSDSHPGGSVLEHGVSPVVKRGRGRGRGIGIPSRVLSTSSGNVVMRKRGRGRRMAAAAAAAMMGGHEMRDDGGLDSTGEREDEHDMLLLSKKESMGHEQLVDQSVDHCKTLIETLCLKRSDLLLSHLYRLSLLRGIPVTLLASSTGIALPEETPTYTLNILEQFYDASAAKAHKISQSTTSMMSSSTAPSVPPPAFCSSPALARLLGLHMTVANYFLYRLFRTIAVRVAVSPASSSEQQPQPVESVDNLLDQSKRLGAMSGGDNVIYQDKYLGGSAPQDFVLNTSHSQLLSNGMPTPDGHVGQQQQPMISYQSDQQMEHRTSSLMATTAIAQMDRPTKEKYKDFRVILVTEYTHRHITSKSSEGGGGLHGNGTTPSSRLYSVPTPFLCVYYNNNIGGTHFCPSPPQQQIIKGLKPATGAGPGAETAVTSLARAQKEQQLETTKVAKCSKSSIRIIGFGNRGIESNGETPGFCCANLNQISEHSPQHSELKRLAEIVAHHRCTVSSRDLEKRVEELNLLKEVAAYLRSIYDDISMAIGQSNGAITAEDGRYFESLWLDLQKKLK